MLRLEDIRLTARKWPSMKKWKDAITHYKVLERFDKYTYMEFKLETGRTHQIRVHMASIGHPLLGDTLYSNGKVPINCRDRHYTP